MFGVMTDSALSVAANAVSANIYAGKLYEFLSRPSIIRVRISAAAAGLNFTFVVGGITYVNDQAISSSNRWPVLPDDMIGQFPGAAGARLIGTYRNTTGGAITVNDVTEVIPIG